MVVVAQHFTRISREALWRVRTTLEGDTGLSFERSDIRMKFETCTDDAPNWQAVIVSLPMETVLPVVVYGEVLYEIPAPELIALEIIKQLVGEAFFTHRPGNTIQEYHYGHYAAKVTAKGLSA